MNRSEDTSLGGPSPRFLSTAWSVLDDLKQGRAADAGEAMSRLVARYWKPVYASIRIGSSAGNEEAKDLTQEFFLFLMEGDSLRAADPGRGRFRSFLKAVLKQFLAGEHRHAKRLKRGGGAKIASLDVSEEELQVTSAPGAGPDDVFDREWARTLMEGVLTSTAAQLRSSGREVQWKVFQSHDLADDARPGYADLASRFRVSEAQVMHFLQDTRKLIRDAVILGIREYAQDDAEVWQEVEYLMGLWRP